jgi:hypothetical protein
MDFYSFRVGDMKTVQADAASPKLMSVELDLGFRAPEHKTVEALSLTVYIPHDPARSVAATQEEAYRAAVALLRAAAQYCAPKTAEELCAETERNKAFVVTSGS